MPRTRLRRPRLPKRVITLAKSAFVRHVARPWSEIKSRGPLRVTRDAFELLFFIISILAIFAAGDAFLIHRRSELDLGVETTKTANKDLVVAAVQKGGLTIDVLPAIPTTVVSGKNVYPSSYTSWKKLTFRSNSDSLSLQESFDKAFTGDTSLAPPDIQTNPWLVALYLRTRQVAGQRSADDLIQQVVNEAITYTLIIEVTNRGDGDSGPIEIPLPTQVTIDNQDGRWRMEATRATIESLHPAETGRLVLSAGRPIEFDTNAVSLKNSTGIVAGNFLAFVAGAVVFTVVVLIWDLNGSRRTAESNR